MADVPGTVSQILWHFTGGPAWNEEENRQNIAPKPAADAYDALLSILSDRVILLGGYKEVVKVRFQKLRIWDQKAKEYKVKRNVMRTLKSAPVCCLADIPIMHLSYHASRYGRFAIGFHRDAALRAGFNPVFYTLHDSDIIRNIRKGFTKIRSVDLDYSRTLIDDIESADEDIDADGNLSALRSEADELEVAITTAKESIAQFLAFIKTFDTNEFQSVYCEREWRSVTQFSFEYSDVAMIVLPKAVSKSRYFEPFVKTVAKRLGVPASVPAVPWETLLES